MAKKKTKTKQPKQVKAEPKPDKRGLWMQQMKAANSTEGADSSVFKAKQ